MNNENTTVFVEVAPWTFVRRAIETGSQEDGSVRIQSGLQVGERVVTKGGVLLND
jgi:cobalt-zinc-cadmium efflux system membrane fusion protein